MDSTIGDPRAVASVEWAFEGQPLPGTWGQVTLRSMAISVVLGISFCFVALRIHMTVGIVPALNMPISVLSFFSVKWLVTLLQSCGIAAAPFTRQENIFLLTTVVTSINMALAGGFATYIIGMSSAVAKSFVDDPDPRDVVDHVPTGRWMLFLFLVGLMAILASVPLNQVMIVDYRLLFPTGSVQAHLINSFHTPQGAYVAKLHVATIFKTFLGSFFWKFFQWFYTAGKDCGFEYFPMFGLELYKHRFYFDFSPTYVGLGMLCPHIVNFGLLSGSILSWGLLYPFFESKNGQWYHTDSTTSLQGSNGYKVFISITIIIADGISNLMTLITTSSIDFNNKRKEKDSGLANYIKKHPSLNYDDRKRIEAFIGQQIPISIPVAGYIACATICTIVIPWFFNQIKFYHVAALYIVTPVFAFCNTYGTGLTDWSVSTTYAKFMTFVIAAWIGKPGAIIASLVACGIIMAALHVSSQATQDLKTGYMTLTSPRAMVIGQIFGVVIGSIINPCIFLAFQRAAKANVPIGSKQSEYPCPYAGLYRAIGAIGTGGVNGLPDHCIAFCSVAFCITIAIKSLVLVSQKKGWTIHNYIPSMTVVALPFFAGSYFAIDMSLGSVLLIIWTKMNSQSAELLSTAVAAGLICGEGLFTLPSAILTMFNVQPPMCMKFLPSGKEIEAVDSFLNNLETPTRT